MFDCSSDAPQFQAAEDPHDTSVPASVGVNAAASWTVYPALPLLAGSLLSKWSSNSVTEVAGAPRTSAEAAKTVGIQGDFLGLTEQITLDIGIR